MNEEINIAGKRMSISDMEEMNLHATASQSAYLRTNQQKNDYMNKHGFGDFRVIPELSDKYNTTLTNGSRIIMAGKGTDIQQKTGTRWGDLMTDAVLALGLETLTPRYKKAKKRLNQIQEKHSDKKVTLTGHSLSGKLIQGIARQSGLEAHVFNSGSTHIHGKQGAHRKLFNSTGFEEEKKKIKNYVVIGDAISNSSLLDPSITNVIVPTHKNVKGSKLNPMYYHDIQHFIHNRDPDEKLLRTF